jgi:pimeloyl-ACP methyl ester carboxylesterase
MTEPFFFPARDGAPLFATWRGASTPRTGAAPCWVICAPFGEEEKSAHRTLVELCEALRARGASTLCFAYRGTGDSGGEFSQSTLAAWREDILAACEEARRRSGSTPGLIGLRLGASLAAQVAREAGVSQLILIEPVLVGRSFLMQLGARKKLRAMMTDEEKTLNVESARCAGTRTSNAERQAQVPFEDYDGWPLGEAMREELGALNLMKEAPPLPAQSEVLVLQVGPRAEVASPLQKWAEEFAAKNSPGTVQTRAVVMPPFWNRLDLVKSAPLCEAVSGFEFRVSDCRVQVASTRTATKSVRVNSEHAVTFPNERGENLVGIWHEAQSAIGAPFGSNSQSAILMLHGWTGYRTGPHQMLTRAARRFAVRGFPVLRFDFAGRGDSDGEAELATLATMAEDARAALRWLEREQGRTRAIVIGLCSGCEVALVTAALESQNVEQLVLWSAPVFAAQQSEARLARKRKSHLKEYARKLLRPTTWAKAISGKVDVRGVQRVLAEGGGQENKNVESGDPGHLPRGWRGEALEKFKRTHMPLFMVYGTADPTTPEALKWHRDLLAARELPVAPEVHLVAGANHSYYGLDWEDEVFDATEKWLAQNSRADLQSI